MTALPPPLPDRNSTSHFKNQEDDMRSKCVIEAFSPDLYPEKQRTKFEDAANVTHYIGG
jgi:hypothetical protein